MDQPPRLNRLRIRDLWIVVGVLALAVVVLFGAYRLISSTGFAMGADQKFGDQNLKTAVALIELHKTRFGRYPTSLADLRYTGDWDALAISSVKYIPAQDRLSYFVEVQRGWIGKPKLHLPPEFWQGTGFNPALDTTRK